MNKIVGIIICFGMLLVNMGCQKDLPEPENKPMIELLEVHEINNPIAIPVVNVNSNQFIVNYHIRGNDVFVDCVVPEISFREPTPVGKAKGKVLLYIDEKKSKEIESAAFIIRGLESGTHRLKVEIRSNKRKPLSREFYITIP